MGQWYSGFRPPPGLWLDEDTEPAAKELISWLLKTVDSVLEMDFWIDSWATSSHHHRQSCHECQRIHDETIRNIPTFLTNADACILIAGVADNEFQRGWILLESTAARAMGKLQGVAISKDITSLSDGLYSLDYICSEEKDGNLIPILCSVRECLAAFEEDRPTSVFEKTENSEWLKNEIIRILTEQESVSVTEHCEKLLTFIRSKKVCEKIDVSDVFAGRILMNIMTIGIRGIVLSALRTSRKVFPLEHGILGANDVLKACIYSCIVVHKHSNYDASRGILNLWFEIMELSSLGKGLIDDNQRNWMAELKTAASTLKYWYADKENVIDITPQDIALEKSIDRPNPEVNDLVEPNENDSSISVLFENEELYNAAIMKVINACNHRIRKLGLGDALELNFLERTPENNLKGLKIIMHDGRLWGDVCQTLVKLSEQFQRPIRVESISKIPKSDLRNSEHFILDF